MNYSRLLKCKVIQHQLNWLKYHLQKATYKFSHQIVSCNEGPLVLEFFMLDNKNSNLFLYVGHSETNPITQWLSLVNVCHIRYSNMVQMYYITNY